MQTKTEGKGGTCVSVVGVGGGGEGKGGVTVDVLNCLT